MKKKSLILLLLITCFAISPTSISAPILQSQEAFDINISINKVIASTDHPHLNKNEFSNYKQALDELYYLSPDHLLWINQFNSDSRKINLIFQLIATADSRGLSKEHYNLTNLQTLWQQLKTQKRVTYSELAALDTAITVNLIHFLSDLHFGRIDPETLAVNFNTPKDPLAFIPLILKAVENNETAQLASQVEPSDPAYHQLKEALLNYRARETGIDLHKLKHIASIHLDESSQQLVAIRQQLDLLGMSTKHSDTPFIYDQDLFDQIKKFQFLHGLEADGVIGKKTIKALNIPLSQYIQKIELALERFRWLPKIQSGPLIMVNIPAFQLRAYHTDKEDEIQSLNMKVIVGQSKDNKSPVFTADLQFLEFSPYWNIPKSIIIDEILPKLLEDPFYLEQHNMELVTGFHNNEPVLPYTEDSFEQLKSGSIKLRQRPGKKNALGRVKFIFPNNYNVYLHDTPSRQLFRKSKRDLSHGCIRVEKPAALANFLLKPKTGWGQKEISKAMRLKSPKKVQLKKAVPVIIYYSTAAIVQDEIVFYDDIYNYDAKLVQALTKHVDASLTPATSIASKN